MRGGELTGKRNRTGTGITDTTDQDERREMMAEVRDLGGKRDRRKKNDLQRPNQDEKDIEMTRESAIDVTKIVLGEIRRSDIGGGKRSPTTGDHTEETTTDEMMTVGHIEETMTDEMMTGKDAGEGEKTTTTVIGEIEADLLGAVKINI